MFHQEGTAVLISVSLSPSCPGVSSECGCAAPWWINQETCVWLSNVKRGFQISFQCFYFHMYLFYLWIYFCSHVTSLLPIFTTCIIWSLFNFVVLRFWLLSSFFMNVHVRLLFSKVPAQSMKLNLFDWRLLGLDLPPHCRVSFICFSTVTKEPFMNPLVVFER